MAPSSLLALGGPLLACAPREKSLSSLGPAAARSGTPPQRTMGRTTATLMQPRTIECGAPRRRRVQLDRPRLTRPCLIVVVRPSNSRSATRWLRMLHRRGKRTGMIASIFRRARRRGAEVRRAAPCCPRQTLVSVSRGSLTEHAPGASHVALLGSHRSVSRRAYLRRPRCFVSACGEPCESQPKG